MLYRIHHDISHFVCPLQLTATHCNALQHLVTPRSTLKHPATQTPRDTAARCSALQPTATYCNTLQHTATEIPPSRHISPFPYVLLLLRQLSLQQIKSSFDAVSLEHFAGSRRGKRRHNFRGRAVLLAQSPWCSQYLGSMLQRVAACCSV